MWVPSGGIFRRFVCPLVRTRPGLVVGESTGFREGEEHAFHGGGVLFGAADDQDGVVAGDRSCDFFSPDSVDGGGKQVSCADLGAQHKLVIDLDGGDEE